MSERMVHPIMQDGQWGGLNLREYFAANAPSDVPNWFTARYKRDPHTAKRPASMDAGLNAQNPRIRAAIREWWKAYNKEDTDISAYSLKSVGETLEERAFLENWERDFTEYAEACANHNFVQAEAIFFAWKWYYADAMLAARKESVQG